MDMSKYKSLFLSEAGEHLNALESELVELDRRPSDIPRIHEVFRHLHSVKGMAGSMGYTELSKLAHQLEDLMAPHRDHGAPLTEDELDLLLRGTDELRSRLAAVAENRRLEPAPADLLVAIQKASALAAKSSVSAPSAAAPAPERPPGLPAPAGPPRGSSGGSGFFQVEAVVSPDCGIPSARAFLVFKRLSEIGEVSEIEPSVNELRAGRLNDGVLRLKLRSNRGAAEIRRITDNIPELDRVEIEPVDQAPIPRVETVASPTPVGVSPTPEVATTSAEIPVSTVRVRTDLLDFFVDAVGELITQRSSFENLAEKLDVPELRENVRRLAGVVRRLHDRVMEVRMVSASLLTQRLPRICRDVARSRNKLVSFSVAGDDVQLDRALVEALDVPLLHLLRNAVDHGIESPEERVSGNKPKEGKIHLAIRRQHDRVLMTLSDDGRGIDPQSVLAHAKAKKLIDPALAALPVEEVIEFIFRPGFSTSDQVSDVSGRGVGLDIVRNTLGHLGGRVTVKSEVGQGTQFILDLPLTVAILHLLLVDIAGHILALPASRVMRALAVHRDQKIETATGKEIHLGRQTLPYSDLLSLLDRGHRPQSRDCGEVVVVGEGDQPTLAIGVDRVAGHREGVLKNVGSILRSLGPFSASSLLGDGRPVLTLDVDALIQRAAQLRRRQENGS